MKTLTHIVLPIVILMGIVGVVAYMTQNTQRSPSKSSPGSTQIVASAPRVRLISVAGSADASAGDDLADEQDAQTSEQRPEEIEFPSKNHRDYVFHSIHQGDIRLTYVKNCKCSTVELGTLAMSDDELAALAKDPSLTGFCHLAQAMNSMTFAPLAEEGVADEQPAVIPGVPAGKPKRPFVLRIIWEAKAPPDPLATSPDTVQIKLIARAGDSAATSNTDLAIRYYVVPSAGFAPANIDMGELYAGGSQSFTAFVFSGTRDRLKLDLSLSGPDGPKTAEPCAEISPCVELTPEERDKLPEMLGKEFKSAKFRCAYRFTITLHEQRGNNVLELGSLSRRLMIHFDTEAGESAIGDATLPLKVLVHGGVRLLDGDAQGRIPIGTFRSDRGTSRTVHLRSEDPKFEIELEQTTDPKLKASLGPPALNDGHKEWEMRIQIDPDAFVGDLPHATAVLLRTVGPNARRMRLPVTGKADR
jgi:hypothetical protein